jgi:hypothetical protein
MKTSAEKTTISKMKNQLIIHTGDTDPKEYAQLIRNAISGTLKKLFEGNRIEFLPEETTAIYYLQDLIGRLEGCENDTYTS